MTGCRRGHASRQATAAVPLAHEALALARQVGAPALIATGLLAVGTVVADTDPGQARACLRESRELSTKLGYHSTIDLIMAAGIAALVRDQAAALELGRNAIGSLQWGDDRRRLGIVLYTIASALATTQPEAAAIIQGATETNVVKMALSERLISAAVTAALGEERVQELRARGADMDWDQALAYTLSQTCQALSELKPRPHHERTAISRCRYCRRQHPRARNRSGHELGLTAEVH